MEKLSIYLLWVQTFSVQSIGLFQRKANCCWLSHSPEPLSAQRSHTLCSWLLTIVWVKGPHLVHSQLSAYSEGFNVPSRNRCILFYFIKNVPLETKYQTQEHFSTYPLLFVFDFIYFVNICWVHTLFQVLFSFQEEKRLTIRVLSLYKFRIQCKEEYNHC